MGLFSKIYGTLSPFFQLGSPTAPGLTNDAGSGNIGAYNASQSSYVNVRGASPVVTNDFVTLGYGNANYGGSSPATETTLGSVYLGAFCYNSIPFGTTVVVPSGQTLIQAGNLSIAGDLDLSTGDIFWVG